uniref:Putative secreted protein n=1 Tax=Ixodes ricinus TaxID=34613 RepID=A0A0K8R5R8_IXORI
MCCAKTVQRFPVFDTNKRIFVRTLFFEGHRLSIVYTFVAFTDFIIVFYKRYVALKLGFGLVRPLLNKMLKSVKKGRQWRDADDRKRLSCRPCFFIVPVCSRF